MKTKKIFIAAAIALLLPLSVCGQAVNASYFIDNSLQRTRLNPAFAPEHSVGYFGIVLGGTNVGVGSNLALEDFLYPKDGQLYTYLNKNVTLEEFTARLKSDPSFNFGLNEELLGFGFRLGPVYVTAGVDLRVDLDMNLPKDLLLLSKQGMATHDQTYDFSGLSIREGAFVESHLGLGIDLSDLVPGLNIGGRVKYLLAAEYAGMRINEGTLRMSDEQWLIKTDAEAVTGANGVTYEDGSIHFPYGPSNVNFCGGGFLFDVGAEWKLKLDLGPLAGLNFSFAMTDIGKCTIRERYTTVYKSAGEAEFSGIKGLQPDSDIETAIQDVIDDLKAIGNIEKTTEQKDVAFTFTPSIRAGLEVALFENHLSTGLLYSREYGFDELRVIENFKLGIFNAAVSYGLLNSHALGFYLGFTPFRKGVNIYFAEEGFPTRYTSPSADGLRLPLGKLNANVRFGINICFETRDR